MITYPYISIVVCAYNEDKILNQCIGALLQQKYPHDKYEIILIDDGSTDHTADICIKEVKLKEHKLPRITYLLIEHSGLSVARNTGVFMSKGDIIAYIDGDAVANEHWLYEIAKAFNNDDNIGAVGGKIKILNKESWFATFIHWIHYYMEDKNGKEIISLIGTNMAFRKEVFQERGGFFEYFRSRGDETSFTKIKILPYFKQNITADAVVRHERPWTFRQWLKERFSNGHEYAIENGISQKYLRSTLKHYLYFIYRIISLSFPILMITALIFDSLLISTATIIIVILFLYRCCLRDSLLIRIKILTREYGYIRSIWLAPLYFGIVMAGKINDDYGFLSGYFNYRNIQTKDIISGDKVKYLLDNSMSSNT